LVIVGSDACIVYDGDRAAGLGDKLIVQSRQGNDQNHGGQDPQPNEDPLPLFLLAT